MKKMAWDARLESKDSICDDMLRTVFKHLITEVQKINDLRKKELIHDTLTWALNNTRNLNYNAKSKNQKKSISPNLIGFQAAYFGIINRAKKSKRNILKITIDQQDQYNTVQDELAEFYRSIEGENHPIGWNIGEMDLRKVKMPLPNFTSSNKSYGLELVDLYLWIFKRYQEKKLKHPDLIQFVDSHMNKSYFDEVSIEATIFRFENWIRSQDPITEEQYRNGQQIKALEEKNRKSFLI